VKWISFIPKYKVENWLHSQITLSNTISLTSKNKHVKCIHCLKDTESEQKLDFWFIVYIK